MNPIADLIDFSARWMRGHLTEIAISITAMSLVVAGPYINAGLKRLARNLHWLLRYALFVLLSTLGYGLITNVSMSNLRAFLRILNGGQLLAAVLFAHLLLAWLLKRDRAI
jgi:hypothetical protein